MNFAEDASLFFTDFAQTVTIGTGTVSAIFQDAYELGMVGPIGMSAAQPMMMLSTSDVPADPVGESVVVGTSTYTVAEHRPDGTGISTLMLEDA
jgi:hypothetical protein